MSKRTLALSAVIVSGCFVAGALAGCVATQTMTAMAGYGLHFADEGESAKLAYGAPNSESVGLMLECAKGSEHIEVTDVARGSTRLTLTSAGKRSDFSGVIQPGVGSGVLSVFAKPDTPALKAFRETGRLDVANGKVRYAIAAKAGEEAAVSRFFNACARAA